jgi:ribosomal 50S subunit-recycling heat shock protein
LRLDKFLKVSRLIKRRTLAKEICDAGRIHVNDRKAKASTDVRVDDTLAIRYGQKTVVVKVVQILQSPRKEEASHLFEIISEEANVVVDTEYLDDTTES